MLCGFADLNLPQLQDPAAHLERLALLLRLGASAFKDK